MMLHNNSSR